MAQRGLRQHVARVPRSPDARRSGGAGGGAERTAGRRMRLLNLIEASNDQLVREWSPWIGRQLQPRHCGGIERTVALGLRWSADNGCFHGFDIEACRMMWARLAGWPGCCFVTAPDVVSDHAATLALWAEWAPVVRELTGGQPLAFVAQNGATSWDDVPEDADAVFIGGDTDW